MRVYPKYPNFKNKQKLHLYIKYINLQLCLSISASNMHIMTIWRMDEARHPSAPMRPPPPRTGITHHLPVLPLPPLLSLTLLPLVVALFAPFATSLLLLLVWLLLLTAGLKLALLLLLLLLFLVLFLFLLLTFCLSELRLKILRQDSQYQRNAIGHTFTTQIWQKTSTFTPLF